MSIFKNKIARLLLNAFRKNKIVLPKKTKYLLKVASGRFKTRYDKKPLTIQLPITYKCNFDCIMCGMRTMINNNQVSCKDLEAILKDDLFSDIKNVGLNGGEPFILANLIDYVSVIINCLPKLKHLYIISNGFFTNSILKTCAEIKKKCEKRSIVLHLSISIDGIGDLQNKMRGHPNAFEYSSKTCEAIMKDQKKYCDTFDTICTITKLNVYNLPEIEEYSKLHNIPVSYNIATIHKRLNNDYKYSDFSIFTDEKARMMAAEFLYSKFLETKSELYFARFYYAKEMKRIANCHHRSGVVTITPNGAISYCAVFSKELGDATKESASSIYFNKDNIAYKKELHNQYCDSCSHYSESLSKEGYRLFFKEIKRLYRM